MIDLALKQLITQRVCPRVNPGTDMVRVTADLPRVVYTLLDDPPTYTDSGRMAARKARYQIDVFGKTYAEARGVMAKLEGRSDAQTNPGLDGYRGTIANTVIHRIYFEGPRVSRGEIATGQNQAIARATVDVQIDYRELLQQPNFTP